MGEEDTNSGENIISEGLTPRKERTGIVLLCTLIGTGVLLPWNAFLTAYDFFADVYVDFPFEFLIGCFYNSAGSLVLFLCIFFGKYLGPLGRRLAICFLIDFFMLIAAPLLAIFVTPDVSVWLVLVAVAFTGAVTAVSFGASMNVSALFGPKSIAGIMTGNGISGLVVSVIRIITKVCVKHTWTGDIISASAYFATAGLIVLICVFASLYLVKTPEASALLAVMEHKGRAQADEEKASLLNTSTSDDTGSMKPIGDEAVAELSQPKKTVKIGPVFKKIWVQAFSVWMVFFVTLSLFPGVATMMKPQVDSGSTLYTMADVFFDPNSGSISSSSSSSGSLTWLEEWFSLILITLFMIFDFIGRLLPSFFIVFSPKTLWIPIVVRTIFFPLFSLMAAGIWTVGVNYFAPIVMILFAFTNGYFSTLAMIFGPAGTEPEESEVASTIMSFSLNFGIFCGSFFSLLLLYFINGSFSV